MPISRRDILKSLTPDRGHGLGIARDSDGSGGICASYGERGKGRCRQPRCTRRNYFRHTHTRRCSSLCNSILPSDEDAKGAIEAGAPEFIDLITSENKEYQASSGRWHHVARQHLHRSVREALSRVDSRSSRRKFSDLIAYRKNAKIDPASGARHSRSSAFSASLRQMDSSPAKSESTIWDTSAIRYVKEFPGCPPVPGMICHSRASTKPYRLPNGCSSDGLCGVNSSAPFSVTCISSSSRMPNSPRM